MRSWCIRLSLVTVVMLVCGFVIFASFRNKSSGNKARLPGKSIVPQCAGSVLPITAQEFLWQPISEAKQSEYQYNVEAGAIVVRVVGRQTILAEVDVNSFVIGVDKDGLSTPFSKDKYHVFYAGESDGAGGAYTQTIFGAQARNFRLLYRGPHYFPMYGTDGNYIYTTVVGDGYISVQPIAGAEPHTFNLYDAVNDGLPYATDSDHVYYGPSLMVDADPKTFVVVRAGTYCDGRDQNYAYRFGTPINMTANNYIEGSI